MIPSPSVTSTADKAAHLQPATGTPEPQFPAGSLPDYDTQTLEFDQPILFGPPPSNLVTDSFRETFEERDDTQNLSTGKSLDLDLITRRNVAAHTLNAQYASQQSQEGQNADDSRPIATALEIRTDIPSSLSSVFSGSSESDSYLRHSISTVSLPKRTPSIRAALHSTAGSLSPGSALSSPQLAAMLNITPLPSPIDPSKDPWRVNFRSRSRGASLVNAGAVPEPTATLLSPNLSPPKRKPYTGLRTSPGETHTQLSEKTRKDAASDHHRTRSVSDYLPDAMELAKPRNVAVSSNIPNQEAILPHLTMHREEYLAVQRGFSVPSLALNTPSTSTSTLDSSADSHVSIEAQAKKPIAQFYTAQSVTSGHPRRYKLIRQLGQGTFSKVFLAVRQIENDADPIDYARDSTNLDGVRIRSRRLVAIKVVEQGPAGGADAERVEVSLQREVEVLKAVNHPSLVHLKALGTGKDRSLLVLDYCPGGDLFDVATSKANILVPSLVRRIFAELVSAVRYLHQKFIVHRDIKLENVLLNIPSQVHADVQDWQTLDRPVVTLTDLGLSRRIPEPPESPLLTTRCGSEDYAAPELLMGQPYDGRQTDAWALGVVLYALMEGRLPFDPLPGARGDPAKLKARTPHRIARCEWAWYTHGDDDGDWHSEKGREYEDARPIVEGLLKRNSRRKGLDEIRELPWVKGGIMVDGGLRRVVEEAI